MLPKIPYMLHMIYITYNCVCMCLCLCMIAVYFSSENAYKIYVHRHTVTDFSKGTE